MLGRTIGYLGFTHLLWHLSSYVSSGTGRVGPRGNPDFSFGTHVAYAYGGPSLHGPRAVREHGANSHGSLWSLRAFRSGTGTGRASTRGLFGVLFAHIFARFDGRAGGGLSRVFAKFAPTLDSCVPPFRRSLRVQYIRLLPLVLLSASRPQCSCSVLVELRGALFHSRIASGCLVSPCCEHLVRAAARSGN